MPAKIFITMLRNMIFFSYFIHIKRSDVWHCIKYFKVRKIVKSEKKKLKAESAAQKKLNGKKWDKII
jgi:hypothetical protein